MNVEIKFSYFNDEKHGRCLRCDMNADGVAYEFATPVKNYEERLLYAVCLKAMGRALEQR